MTRKNDHFTLDIERTAPGGLPGNPIDPPGICGEENHMTTIIITYTLSATGQYTVYTLEMVRMVVKESTATTTYIDAVINGTLHDAVWVSNSNYNAGTETTLETVLNTAATSLGADMKYLPTSTGTAMNWIDWANQSMINVKSFGATGDGAPRVGVLPEQP